MLPRAATLLALFALFSSLFLHSLGAVINPVAAAEGNKNRICLRSCKYISINAAGSTVEVSAISTSSASMTYHGSTATVLPDATIAAVEANAPSATPANAILTAPLSNGAFGRMTTRSLSVLVGVAASLLFLI